MKASSSIAPAAHHSALFLIQFGISFPELAPCVVDGMSKMPSLIKNWIPWMKASSSIAPAAHHSALFLIQFGMMSVFSLLKIDWELNSKLDVDTRNISKLLEYWPVKLI